MHSDGYIEPLVNRKSAEDFESCKAIGKPAIDAIVDKMEGQRIAFNNIFACREALKAFEPIASPDLLRELTEAVDRYEDRVREFHGMEPRK